MFNKLGGHANAGVLDGPAVDYVLFVVLEALGRSGDAAIGFVVLNAIAVDIQENLTQM